MKTNYKRWDKIYTTKAAAAKHLIYMASIVDNVPADQRELFDSIARETMQNLEMACCDRNGELTDRGMQVVDSVFAAYCRCIIE